MSKTQKRKGQRQGSASSASTSSQPGSAILGSHRVQSQASLQKPPPLGLLKNSRTQDLVTRSFWGLLMIVGFVAILWLGPVAVIFLVVLVQGIVYKEVISIGTVPVKQRKSLPWFRSLHWYFLASTNYFLYGQSLIHYFEPFVLVDAFLMPLATHHRFISFSLYVFGFMVFVVNLKKGHYKFQFSQFCWTHMALLMVVITSHFIINNLFEGLIWFVLPVSLVIVNDIMAYFFGFCFGKTPLIRLSPKKTVEGFVGGAVTTVLFGFFFSAFLLQFPSMTQSLRCQTTGSKCSLNPVFLLHSYPLHPIVTGFIRLFTTGLSKVLPFGVLIVRQLELYPLQVHAIAFASFASLIAPFGGFFASGVKRAFNMKDFSDSIPGHGGLTDRMDCQFIMGVFSFMYLTSFLDAQAPSTSGGMLHTILALKPEQVMEVYLRLGDYLKGQGQLE